ncbi:ankyrin repeat domain-containing protein 31 isoform X3 [Oryzias melastigma]|uniref:ankyrin repeat domain-containing protein 31 isoform X3 n=1 Tax=Oryzias melastigma TaxID=30732 RepID=UPI00168D455F|nr:ankyrin repeat domain-containing protein 31 isoform X3 [Oryzias melastigma]
MLQMDDGPSSCSDDDSVSLLHDLSACHVTDAAVDQTTLSGSHVPLTCTQTNTERNPKELKAHQKEEAGRRKQPEADFEESAEFEKVCKPLKAFNHRTLHKRDSMGETLLHKASKKNNVADVRTLIQAGISVDVEDYAGWTALHEAAARGHVTVVKELLKAGANSNARCRGVTPLHDAVCAGHHQVVKLLLESGSNPCDRNAGGISALEMTKNEEMKELLLTVTAAAAQKEGTQRTRHIGPGAASSAPRCSDPTHTWVREAGDGPSNLHLMKSMDPNLSNSVGRRAALEKLKGKQTEMSAWPLMEVNSVDRFLAALVQIQSVLKDILSKQRLEKDSLYRRFQKVSNSFRHRVLRTHLLSLASCQKSLVEVLQTQSHLEETLVAARLALQAPSSTVQCSSVTREKMHHTTGEPAKETGGSYQVREQDERSGPLKCLLKGPPRQDLQSDRSSIFQKSQPAETSLQQVKMKGQNALIQSRHLRLLVQGGALAPGSALQLLWKHRETLAFMSVLLQGKLHCAHVMVDGSMMSEGKVFQAPERWLEWIIGNNIPVGSGYALDKVTFRDVPLSQLLLNMEADKKRSHTEDSSQHSMDVSARPPHAAAGSLSFLLNIRTVHLMADEEFMPSTMMDHFWDQLLQKDFPESDNWNALT